MRARLPALTVVSLLLLLAACGGDNDGAEVSAAPAGDAAEGRAVKGVLQGAEVTLQVLAGSSLVTYDITTTGDDGSFAFDALPEGPFKVVLSAPSAGGGRMLCDGVPDCGPSDLHPLDSNANGVFDFGEAIPIPDDFELSAWFAEAPASAVLAVTPMTHLAATLAESYPGAVDADAVAIANATVAALFDLDDDFFSSWPLAMTDEGAAVAGGSDIHHALLSAGFASLATSGDMQAVLDEYAGALVELGGQLPLADASGDLEALIQASIGVADDLLDEGATLSQTAAALQLLVQRWSGSHTMVATDMAVNAADLERALIPLDDLDHYLNLANINGNGEFFSDQVGQLEWLYQQASLDFAAVTLEAAGLIVVNAMIADFIAEEYNLAVVNFSVNDINTAFDVETRLLTVSKVANGDLVSITVTLDDLLAGAEAGGLSYSLDGTVLNTVVGGSMNGAMDIDLYDTDILPLVAVAQGIVAQEPGVEEADLFQAILDLLPSMHGRVTVTGDMALFKVEDPEFSFTVEGSAWGELDIPAFSSGGDVLALEISYGSITSPWGDSIYSLEEETPALAVTVGEDGVLDARFGFEAFGMPAMEVSADGRLDGIGLVLAEVIENLDLGAEASDALAIFSTLDYSVLDLYGSATLDIPSDDKRYEFDLDGFRVDVSLPNSVEQGLQFHLTSINGGYLYSGESLVGTVTFDWANTGATIFLLDGTTRSYFLGPIDDILPAGLAELLGGLL